MKKSIITIVTPLIFLCSYGWSAEFNWSTIKETNHEESILTIRGEIEKGDSEKLLKQILSHEHLTEILLDSPGGIVDEAIKMSSVISGLKIATRVVSEKICASSCFFLYLAGEPRQSSGMTNINGIFFGRVGLHRPYFNKEFFDNNMNENSTKKQEELMNSVSRYLQQQMVPNYLIEMMMRNSSSEIYLLGDKDIQILGEIYPPREELLTAKCGYKKNKSFDPIQLITNYPKEMKCILEIQANDRFLFREKIKTGWKPWNPEIIIQRKLVKMFGDNKMTIYYDENSITKNGSIVQYSELTDLKEKIVSGTGELKIVVGSFLYQNEIDCSKSRIRSIKSITYSDGMGKGQITSSDDTIGKYLTVSNGSLIHKAICVN